MKRRMEKRIVESDGQSRKTDYCHWQQDHRQTNMSSIETLCSKRQSENRNVWKEWGWEWKEQLSNVWFLKESPYWSCMYDILWVVLEIHVSQILGFDCGIECSRRVPSFYRTVRFVTQKWVKIPDFFWNLNSLSFVDCIQSKVLTYWYSSLLKKRYER